MLHFPCRRSTSRDPATGSGPQRPGQRALRPLPSLHAAVSGSPVRPRARSDRRPPPAPPGDVPRGDGTPPGTAVVWPRRPRRAARGPADLVPPDALEVVAHHLLVEALRGAGGRVGGRVPEPRRVRGYGLVDQHELVSLQPELELRVHEDEPTPLRGGRSRAVQRQARLLEAPGEGRAD